MVSIGKACGQYTYYSVRERERERERLQRKLHGDRFRTRAKGDYNEHLSI